MNKKTTFIIRLSPYLKNAVEDLSEMKGESQAAIIRDALREKLERSGYVVKDKKKK